MAYAGICSSDNLQPHSDPYFSVRSIEEFEATTAATPGTEQEEQVVNLRNFGAGDSFTLTCSTCDPPGTVFASGGVNYNLAQLAIEITNITGQAATVTTYDDATTLDAAGFTVHWAAPINIPTLTANVASGAFQTFTGTIVNGGPDTNGGTLVPSTDHAPVVTAPADKTIPTRTPFTLTGSATDQEGDPHIFQWEQTDSGVGPGTSLVSNTKVNGPLFRVFGTYADVDSNETLLYNSPSENLAGTDPSRTFPDLPQIVAGNTNAKTGTCPAPLAAGPLPVSDPALNCFSEFLPTSTWVGTGNRVMHFRLTTRDEFSPDPQADHVGGVAWDDVALTVDPTAGPFLVTSQATSAPQSGPTLVTWNVAGTDAASMAPNVRISLSTDGGQTFPTVLVASTPNDGQAPVLLPSNISTTTARIKVEAIGNYFFDLSDANFTIPLGGPNKAPVVDAGPDKAVQVGTAYTASGAFADENAGTAVASVDYGDGQGPQPLALTGSAFTLNHTYATSGAKTVTVRVTDSGSLVGTDTATVTVTKAGSTIKASSKPKKVTEDRAFKVKATVTSAIGAPTGKVKVYKGNKLIGKGTLHNGKVKIKIKQKKAEKLKVGKNKLTAKYLGSAAVAASQDDFKVTVVRKKR
jgi:hypothetical protein